MTDFKKAYGRTELAEGGYSIHPSDRGGETYKGIARKFHPKWEGWIVIDMAKKMPGFPDSLRANASMEKSVQEFYKDNYWEKVSGDFLYRQDIANAVFDSAVNMGVAWAGRLLQRTLNILNNNGRYYPDIKVDGKIGPITVAAIKRYYLTSRDDKEADRIFIFWYNAYRVARYIAIAEKDRSQEIFIRGWGNRVQIKL